jgi:Flp pilus assembly CpaE family ATPase
VSVPVLTAVPGADWEADLVAALEGDRAGVNVVRRCVDLPDLLSAAAAGTARAALLSADLRRLDRDALTRLAAARVAVVGLVTPGDEIAERRLRQLGVSRVLPADTATPDIAAAVAVAIAELDDTEAGRSYADPLTALPDLPPRDADDRTDPLAPGGTGRIVAVWGPTGAPGRTSVAVGLAAELAAVDPSALLVDADVYGGTVAPVLGMLDEAPGLAAAARQANAGTLDLPALARLAPVVGRNLRVLTGIARADRWPELRPAALQVVLDLARRLATWTVVDTGFCLEEDEELSFDTAAPRRNGATLEVLARSDVVVAVGAADPVGVQRLVRGLSELREVAPRVQPCVVLNRVRRSAVGAEPERRLAEALERYAGVTAITFIPEDWEAYDAALLQGRTLAETAPSSPARRALAGLASDVCGRTAAGRRRGRRRRA